MYQYFKNTEASDVNNLMGGDGITVKRPLLPQLPPHMRLFNRMTLQPGCSIGEHSHKEEAEIFYILEGQATLTDNDETITLYPGDVQICLADNRHSIRNNGSEPLHFLAIIPTEAK